MDRNTPAAWATGERGRKPAMTDSDIKKAAAMLSDSQITKTEVAAHFHVTRTTLNASLKRMIFSDLSKDRKKAIVPEL